MKCLSISQPFANLIISGIKTIELRKWNTNFRGEFLIHAPVKIRTWDVVRLKVTEKLVTGAIIGRAELYDVKKYYSLEEITNDEKFHLASKDFQDRTFGFMIKNARSLKVPILLKGKLGFFDVIPERIKDKDIVNDIIDEEYRYRWIDHH